MGRAASERTQAGIQRSSRRELLAYSGCAIALQFAPPRVVASLRAGSTGDAPTWDLSPLFPSDAAWDAAERATVALVAQWEAPVGRFAEDEAVFGDTLVQISALRERIARIVVYAKLRAAEDLASPSAQERRQRALTLEGEMAAATAWLEPAILSLGRERALGLISSDPRLAGHRFPVEELFRLASHAPPSTERSALASASTLLDGPQAVYNQIIGSGMPHPTITLSNGESAVLDDAGYTRLRSAVRRGDRRRVFDLFWSSYGRFEGPFGATLAMQAGAATYSARLRGYPDALAATLDGGDIPRAVFTTMIAEARRGVPMLQRYLRLRREALGLTELRYYDLYAPIAPADRSFGPEDKRRLMLRAVAPLGNYYVQSLLRATASRWMDMRSAPGRYAGAFTNGDAYGVHPFLLLGPGKDHRSLSEYVHEWGHAMHSVLANASQPFETARYSPFVAEIASTTNEMLLAHSMRLQARTDVERLVLVFQELELLRLNMFREPMLSEFELFLHERVGSGQPVTGQALSRHYLALMNAYHAPEVTIDPTYAVEWTFIPQFYTAFYSFQYATSIAASSFFSSRLLVGDGGVRTRYLDMLRAGGSASPYALVRRAGVDLATPDPYRAALEHFAKLLDEAEALVGATRHASRA